ncbi:uncharacterized protein PRCAT00003441001 [Priceomyces carsonii]|uniref:uncharacterized protein n=1 Tax=Priceomyces carsonii TaxID=28549 RepID=UPI002EDA0CF9|nr:unnamed protein product [Priceomyces carsonii]
MVDQSEGDAFTEIFPKVLQVTRASSSLGAQDVNFLKSIDKELSKEIDNSGEKILDVVNKLLKNASNEAVEVPYGKDEISNEASWKKVGNSLDSIFEKVDIAFDQANKLQEKSRNGGDLMYLEDTISVENPNRHPSKSNLRPQLNFRVKVDNSEETPFKPKLTTKPNALQSYEQSTQLVVPEKEDDSDIQDHPHYMQPYEYEILNQPYPDAMFSKSEPIRPTDWRNTSAIWVDSIESLNEMIKELSTLSVIAVDLEHHDYRTYYGIVCLMQISNRDQDWIVDTLVLRDDLEPLNTIFTNPNIIKVFHGAFMDIIWLQRDLGLYVVSLFDTYFASKLLGFPKFSLAYLLEAFASFKTSKKYQLADWRIRPLLSAMLAYARSDTHFLLYVFDQLKNKLIDAGNDKLQKVLFESREVARRRFEFTKFRPLSPNSKKVACPVMANNPKEPFSSIMYQYHIPFHRKPLIEALYYWRDAIAKREDESVRYVMSNQLLVDLSSLSEPVDTNKILSCSNYISDHVRSNAASLAILVEKTLKEMAENDWELANKWSNDSVVKEDDTIQLNENFVSKSADVFEALSEKQKSHLEGNELLCSDSIFLTDHTKFCYAIDYDIKKKLVSKHGFMEIKSRLEHLLNELEKFNHVELQSVETPNDEPVSSEQEISEAEERMEPESQNEKLDPNEVITLRKRNVQKPKAQKEVSQEPALDYNSPDKVLLTNKSKKTKNERKRKAFDPYSNLGDGPPAFKRSRGPTRGKSSTFSKKRSGK